MQRLFSCIRHIMSYARPLKPRTKTCGCRLTAFRCALQLSAPAWAQRSIAAKLNPGEVRIWQPKMFSVGPALLTECASLSHSVPLQLSQQCVTLLGLFRCCFGATRKVIGIRFKGHTLGRQRASCGLSVMHDCVVEVRAAHADAVLQWEYNKEPVGRSCSHGHQASTCCLGTKGKRQQLVQKSKASRVVQ